MKHCGKTTFTPKTYIQYVPKTTILRSKTITMAAFFRTLVMYWMDVPENDGCRHFKTSKY